MNKKYLVITLIVICILCCSMFFIACNDNDAKKRIDRDKYEDDYVDEKLEVTYSSELIEDIKKSLSLALSKDQDDADFTEISEDFIQACANNKLSSTEMVEVCNVINNVGIVEDIKIFKAGTTDEVDDETFFNTLTYDFPKHVLADLKFITSTINEETMAKLLTALLKTFTADNQRMFGIKEAVNYAKTIDEEIADNLISFIPKGANAYLIEKEDFTKVIEDVYKIGKALENINPNLATMILEPLFISGDGERLLENLAAIEDFSEITAVMQSISDIAKVIADVNVEYYYDILDVIDYLFFGLTGDSSDGFLTNFAKTYMYDIKQIAKAVSVVFDNPPQDKVAKIFGKVISYFQDIDNNEQYLMEAINIFAEHVEEKWNTYSTQEKEEFVQSCKRILSSFAIEEMNAAICTASVDKVSTALSELKQVYSVDEMLKMLEKVFVSEVKSVYLNETEWNVSNRYASERVRYQPHEIIPFDEFEQHIKNSLAQTGASDISLELVNKTVYTNLEDYSYNVLFTHENVRHLGVVYYRKYLSVDAIEKMVYSSPFVLDNSGKVYYVIDAQNESERFLFNNNYSSYYGSVRFNNYLNDSFYSSIYYDQAKNNFSTYQNEEYNAKNELIMSSNMQVGDNAYFFKKVLVDSNTDTYFYFPIKVKVISKNHSIKRFELGRMVSVDGENNLPKIQKEFNDNINIKDIENEFTNNVNNNYNFVFEKIAIYEDGSRKKLQETVSGTLAQLRNNGYEIDFNLNNTYYDSNELVLSADLRGERMYNYVLQKISFTKQVNGITLLPWLKIDENNKLVLTDKNYTISAPKNLMESFSINDYLQNINSGFRVCRIYYINDAGTKIEVQVDLLNGAISACYEENQTTTWLYEEDIDINVSVEQDGYTFKIFVNGLYCCSVNFEVNFVESSGKIIGLSLTNTGRYDSHHRINAKQTQIYVDTDIIVFKKIEDIEVAKKILFEKVNMSIETELENGSIYERTYIEWTYAQIPSDITIENGNFSTDNQRLTLDLIVEGKTFKFDVIFNQPQRVTYESIKINYDSHNADLIDSTQQNPVEIYINGSSSNPSIFLLTYGAAIYDNSTYQIGVSSDYIWGEFYEIDKFDGYLLENVTITKLENTQFESNVECYKLTIGNNDYYYNLIFN